MWRPIFCEAAPGEVCPTVEPDQLASAITETIDAGARILNLSLGLGTTSLSPAPRLRHALDYAFRKGVVVVAAAGNHGIVGPVPLLSHPWVIPVVATDATGRVHGGSNVGISIGKRGLRAPGRAVWSTSSSGGHTQLTGTSVAAPFVSGAAALLWSLHPGASAADVRAALLQPGVSRRNLIPPLLDAEASRAALGARTPSTTMTMEKR